MSAGILIAVIDDDDSFRSALVESLFSQDYSVRGFSSAEEFMEIESGSPWNCIITDIQMPRMSGLDLKQLLVARGSKVPVIMITARTDADLEARAWACGAVCLLTKPFSADHLSACIEKSQAV